MKVFLTYIFLSSFLSLSAFAQRTLYIRDLDTNKPLSGASVLNPTDNSVVISDAEGKAVVDGIPENTKLTISYVGYATEVYTLKPDQNIVYLKPSYEMLSNLTVVGNDNDRRLYEIAGSYVINSKSVMSRFNNDSPVRSMNTLPGIRFEQRSPESYRVSIRGNLLRAPYGVRNVKVYWNEIPFTDPAGNTPLNLLDMNNISKIETFKGPIGSIYGAGIGGAINIYSDVSNQNPVSADLAYTTGSFGYQKVAANLNSGGENYRFNVRYAKQKADGYRDHTSSDREVIQMGGTFYTSVKRTLSAQVLYSDLFYETPGGLTQAQYDENPQQARPGAEDKNSSIDHQNFLLGIVQDYEWNETISNTTSLYFTNGIKENPFINNYELEKMKSYGGRTSFDIKTHIKSLPTEFTAGAEINFGDLNAGNHGNVGGYADTLRYVDELKSLQTFAFLQMDMKLSKVWTLTLAGSLNYLNYNINRMRDVAADTSYVINRKFNPEFMPRLGIVGNLSNTLAVHGSISTGFSPPTTEEVRTSDGGINADLEAEKGTNYEIGLRGNSAKDNFYFDLAVFWMQQKETIVSKTTDQGTVIFENAGGTSQLGLELLAGYAFIDDPSKTVSLVKIQTAYTRHNFTFNNYVKRSGNENIDYSGNNLTGTAPNISVTTFDIESKGGGYFNFTYNFTDEIPLNDANTAYGNSYQLITIKGGWKINIKQKYIANVFAGIDNLLNEKYSLGNDLNAFGGRYFNAAPVRNYFGGVNFYFNKL